MKNIFITLLLFLIIYPLSAQIRLSKFEKVSFSLRTRELPTKPLPGEYKTVKFNFIGYNDHAILVDSSVQLIGFQTTKNSPDFTITLFANKLFVDPIIVEETPLGFLLHVNYICPISYELRDKNKIKIDGSTLDNGNTWKKKNSWVYSKYFMRKVDALNYFEANKEDLMNNFSEERIKEAIPEFEKMIAQRYGFRTGDMLFDELIYLKNSKDEKLLLIQLKTMEAAILLNTINENTQLDNLRLKFSSIISFYENLNEQESENIYIIKFYNMMLISYYLENFDNVFKYASKLNNKRVTGKYMLLANERRNGLKKIGISSYCFEIN